jgi:hypothetical protein
MLDLKNINGSKNWARSTSTRERMIVIAGKPRVGRIQRQIRRALIANNCKPLSIRELLRWCYPAVKQHPRWHRWSIHRALPKFAIPHGRNTERQGRPMIWSPRSEICRIVAKPLPKPPMR